MFLLLALALGAAPPHAKAAPPNAPPPAMAALMKSCSAHKFETVVETIVDGHQRRSTVKLCGQPGQSDAQWTRTLEDAAAKIDTNGTMSADVKAQISSALRAEIGKARIADTGRSAAAGTAIAPLASAPSLGPVVDVPTLELPDPIVARPMPVLPPVAPVARRASMATVASAPWSKPRLGISCYTPGDLTDDGPCTIIERDTVVSLRAGEDLASGIGFRFARKDGIAADAALPPLARGKTLRMPLPLSICGHVSGGQLRLQLVRIADGQAVDLAGPFLLRC